MSWRGELRLVGTCAKCGASYYAETEEAKDHACNAPPRAGALRWSMFFGGWIEVVEYLNDLHFLFRVPEMKRIGTLRNRSAFHILPLSKEAASR